MPRVALIWSRGRQQWIINGDPYMYARPNIPTQCCNRNMKEC